MRSQKRETPATAETVVFPQCVDVAWYWRLASEEKNVAALRAAIRQLCRALMLLHKRRAANLSAADVIPFPQADPQLRRDRSLAG